MCEILVRAVDGVSGDVTANPLRGYPVVVQPDGHEWGAGERLPEYVVLRLNGVSPDLVRQYLERWLVLDGDIINLVRRRRYRIPEVIVSQAESNGGFLNITRTRLANEIIDQSA